MPILFAGSSISDFDQVSGALPITTAILPGIGEGVRVAFANHAARARLKQEASAYWVSFYSRTFTNNTSISGAYIGAGGGTTFPTAGLRWRVRWEIDSIMLDVLTTNAVDTVASMPVETLMRFDVRCKIHPTAGEILVYIDGVLRLSFFGNTLGTEPATDNALTIRGSGSIYYYAYSAIIVSTADSRLFQMQNMPITGQGALAEWIGPYANITEVGIDWNNFVYSDVLGARTTYTVTKPTPPVGFGIGAIVVGAQVSKYGADFTGVTAIQYDGTTDSTLGDYTTIDVLYEGRRVIAEVNPATGVKFTPEEYAAMEIGFKVS